MPNETTDIAAAGGIGNQALYRMCSEWPTHKNREHIIDKMLFIARPYSAARNLGGEWEAIAEALQRIGPEIDRRLGELRAQRFPKCRDRVIELHALVDRAVCDTLRSKKAMKDSNPDGGSRSSFVSKYLHFHAPDAIPIFDSLAKRGLQSQTKGFRTALKKPSNYERFCERLAHLIERKGMDGDSLRAIDKWLVIEGRKLKNAKGE